MAENPRSPDDKPDTRPQQPSLPPEMPDEEATSLQSDLTQTKDMPPVTVPPEPAKPPAPPRRLTATTPPRPQPAVRLPPVPPKQPGAMHLPVWSVALTLMLVCGAVACIVLGVVSLGGRPVPAGAPRFVILTAALPTSTPFVPDSLAPTVIPNQLMNSGTIPPFSLQGPTLAPVAISPTPENIAVGKTVITTAEDSGVNVRSAAGIQNERLFVADNGETFTVVDGPTQADGLTWWKIESPTDSSRTGWAAASFLELAVSATQPP